MTTYKSIINNTKCNLIEFNLSSDYSSMPIHTELDIKSDKDLNINLYDNKLIKLLIYVVPNYKIIALGILKNFKCENMFFNYNFDIISYTYEDYDYCGQIISEIKKYKIDEILNR